MTPIKRWSSGRKFMTVAYVFALLAVLPMGLTDIKAGKAGLDVLVLLPPLALVYVIPFGCVFICWRLWRRFSKIGVSDHQQAQMLLGIWVVTATLFYDVIFLLPFEQGNFVERQFTIRSLGPIIVGAVLSPVLTLLGALAGATSIKICRRWALPGAAATLITPGVVLAELTVLAGLALLFGPTGVGAALLIAAAGAVGANVKARYSDPAG